MEEQKITFNEFGLSKEIMKAISSMGFEEPTPIQQKIIPIILEGKDVIGQSQTGTGKTAAFGMPIIEKIDHTNFSVQALILVPTRELAIQVAEEINNLGKFKKIIAIPIYGGTSIDRQIRFLKKGVQIVIGTPGRIMDHMERRTLKLKNVKIVVLDEADEMLDMGFVDDITTILKETSEERQTLLFSATMPTEIVQIAKQYMKSPEKVKIALTALTAPKINQIFYEVHSSEKMEALCKLIDAEESNFFLVFCHTKREVDEVASNLKIKGYEAEAIHGDFSQAQREFVMKKFRESKIDVLVATDVAARGLDISNITHVVNYNIPQNPESYIHRIGRTGRAGKEGIAITFVTPREERQLRFLQSVSETKIKKGKLPSMEQIFEVRTEDLKEKIQQFIDNKRFDIFLKMAEKLSKEIEPINIVASLLKFQLEGFRDPVKENLTSFENTGAESGMVRLFMTVGRNKNIKVGNIIKTFAEKASISGNVIGKVDIYDKFTFVEVPKNVAEKVIEAMHQTIICGEKVTVTSAKPKRK